MRVQPGSFVQYVVILIGRYMTVVFYSNVKLGYLIIAFIKRQLRFHSISNIVIKLPISFPIVTIFYLLDFSSDLILRKHFMLSTFLCSFII